MIFYPKASYSFLPTILFFTILGIKSMKLSFKVVCVRGAGDGEHELSLHRRGDDWAAPSGSVE